MQHSPSQRPAPTAPAADVAVAGSSAHGAEHALRQSEERFRLATEAMQGLLYDLDLARGTVVRSAAMHDLIGIHPHEAPADATWWAERIHPDDLRRAAEAFGRATAMRAPSLDIEYRVRHRDGHHLWVWDHQRLVYDADGTVTRIVGCTIDIEARKRAEREIEELADRFRIAAESSGTLVYEVDLEAQLVVMAYGLARIVGETGLRAPFPDQRWHDRVHPDDLAGELARVRRELEAPGVNRYVAAYRLRHADGAWRHVEDRGTVLRSSDGRPLRLVGAVTDVTERRAASERLVRSEQRLHAVLANTRSAIFLMDERQQCVYMNRAAELLTGYTLADAAGRPLHDVVHHTRPDGTPYPVAECPIDRALPERAQQSGEEVFVHRDGTFYPVAFTASPMRDADERVIGTVIEARGIREEVRTREALREADRRKDEFIATLSHELRNPLAPLRNGLHVLRLAGKGDPAAAPVLDMMERQVGHLVRLIDDLLELSRISTGALQLRRARVEVAATVRNAVETVQPLIDAASHRLDVVLPASPLWVDGDPVRLAQILSNLLNNAAKYTEAGGRILVSAAREGGTVAIRVRDDGVGIAPADLERVFGLFARGDRASSRGQGGLGIGLALSRELARMHGGAVTAHSDGPGRGSEFVLRLPAAAGPGAADTAAQSASAPLPPRRVLVVDDNHDAGDSLALIVKVLGADVRIARDGPEALAAYETWRPAAVLLDIGMPGMDGYEVARRMRAAFPQRRATLIALTGWGQDEDRRLAREAGFDHHLVKPADISVLRALLAAAPASP